MTATAHLDALATALEPLRAELDLIGCLGRHAADVLLRGGRVLAAGNGGSAAQAQHLTAELVGRFRDERQPLSAIALTADTASVTAICNDYGPGQVFARQVQAHGRPGDVFVALSTSGRSANVIAAAQAARGAGVTVWGLTGSHPNPLADHCDEVIAVSADATATVQEVHLAVIHMLCAAIDAAIGGAAVPDDQLQRPEHLTAQVTDAGAAPARSPLSTSGTWSAESAGAPLLIVGDSLLDRDLDGDAHRLAPDAPIPVVADPDEQVRPGGSALAALLAARTGRDVALVTALADDDAGRTVATLLRHAGVEVVDMGARGTTGQKVRVRAGGQPLLRVDHGGHTDEIDAPEPHLLARIRSARTILVSDYGRGIAAQTHVRTAISAAATAGARVVWDPHPRGPAPVAGTRVVTPNLAEAQRAAGVAGDDRLPAVADLAVCLRETWQAGAVAVTLGARGALLASGAGTPLLVPSRPVPGSPDPCGAGDQFAVGVAGAIADGAVLSEAVTAGVHAATAFVATGGVRNVTPHDGRQERTPARIDERSARHGAADEVIAAVRARGGTVVATGGCFDLLHAGHVQLLADAATLGDCLVVCLNSDASVCRLKGAGRPVVPDVDRAAVLMALRSVDAVVLFDEDTPEQILEHLRPDVWVKGGDYALTDLPEADLVASWGGRAVVVPYLDGRSTTALIKEAVRHARS